MTETWVGIRQGIIMTSCISKTKRSRRSAIAGQNDWTISKLQIQFHCGLLQAGRSAPLNDDLIAANYRQECAIK